LFHSTTKKTHNEKSGIAKNMKANLSGENKFSKKRSWGFFLWAKQRRLFFLSILGCCFEEIQSKHNKNNQRLHEKFAFSYQQ
jgi:hypothetical protein